MPAILDEYEAVDEEETDDAVGVTGGDVISVGDAAGDKLGDIILQKNQ